MTAMKPDAPTAMRQLIAQVRQTLPLNVPEARLCPDTCNVCSVKLLDHIESELDHWEQRLDMGERPGLTELSRLARSSKKVYRALQKNGLIPPGDPPH